MSSLLQGEFSNAFGLSAPVFRFVIAFLATLPVSWGWRRVSQRSPYARHCYAGLGGLLISHYGLPDSDVLLFLPIAISYVAMLACRRWCGLITFALAFSFLMLCHVHFKSGESWQRGGIDATGALMVITLKVISAAINYQDGLIDETSSSLRPAQTKNRITTLPNPIAFVGYCLNCGSHLAGPVFEFNDYIDWTNNQTAWSSPDTPSYIFPFLKTMAKAFCCLGFHMLLSPKFNHSTQYYDSKLSFSTRFAYLWMCGFTMRWKFYFIWSISEAALILSGFGFSGWEAQEGKPKRALWNRARNVNIVQVELNDSGALLPLHWNIHVGSWLRHYVYDPLNQSGGHGDGQERRRCARGLLQLVATQLVTAAWHGLYMGYFLFFVHSALMIAGARVLHKWRLWMMDDEPGQQGDDTNESIHTSQGRTEGNVILYMKKYLDSKLKIWRILGKNVLGSIVGFLYGSIVLHYAWAGFLLLNLNDTLLAYKRLYYVGTSLPLLVLFLGRATNLSQLVRSKSVRLRQ